MASAYVAEPSRHTTSTPEDYAKLAARTAGAMKLAHKDLELVVCGSSGSWMPLKHSDRVAAASLATCTTARHGEASLVDAVANVDEGRAAVFPVNRDLAQATQVIVDVRSLGSSRILEALTLADKDAYAKNTLTEQDRVTLHCSASSRRRCRGPTDTGR